MTTYNFDDRVAVVTGAGRGIGKAYALLLAERGAKVVVNDLGGSTAGVGLDPAPAATVADEIRAAGGTAIPNANDISSVEGGQSLIDAAIAEFGRVDIVVNNAGNIIFGGLPDVDADNIERHLAVHTMGSFNVTHAAWPHMLERGYGRVVLTTSTGVFGLPDNLGYAVAKSSMIGMAKSMTASAGEHDIKVNVIAPNAMTRMGGEPSEGMDALKAQQSEQARALDPALVAPLVAYLAHEACNVSGEIYVGGGGRFAREFLAVADGFLLADPDKATIEDVAENWAAINDVSSFYIPASLMDWAGKFFAHRA